MSHTLPLFDTLLLQAHRRQQAGHPQAALLARLLGFPDLPADASAEAHTRLGEWHLKRRRFKKARRHLRAALALSPEDARLHHRLGLCLASDPDGRPELAYRHYRQALKLDATRVVWRGEAGLLALRLGRTEEGLSLLRSAHEQAPDDAGALGRLVKGLCQTGRPDEALRLVRLARFRQPRRERLLRLESDLLLARLRRSQEETAARRRQAEGPVLLPFLRVQPEAQADGARADRPHTLPGPHLVHLRVRAGRRLS